MVQDDQGADLDVVDSRVVVLRCLDHFPVGVLNEDVEVLLVDATGRVEVRVVALHCYCCLRRRHRFGLAHYSLPGVAVGQAFYVPVF